MSDEENQKATAAKGHCASVKDLIRQLQTLSPEERALVSEALQPSVKPRNPGVKREPEGLAGSLEQTPIVPHLPRLATFSGDAAKGEMSYEHWRFEVRGLQKDHVFAEPLILQAIRRSLRGKAAEVVLHLGEEVHIQDILQKMDKIFGNVLPSENILELFYTARQETREDIASWACRIEDLLAQLRAKNAVTSEVSEVMLKTKFYSGLRLANVKNAIRHKFDGGDSYSDLIVAARVAELETSTSTTTKTAKVNQATTLSSSENEKLDKVLSNLAAVTKRLEKLEEHNSKLNKKDGPRAGHWKQRSSSSQQRAQNTQTQMPPLTFNDSVIPNAPLQQHSLKQQQQAFQGLPQRAPSEFQGNCYNCGGYGHRAANCPLNSQQLPYVGKP